MKFSLLTYNTLFNHGINEIDFIFKKFSPDIVCFQELLIDEKNIKKIEDYGYSLAEYHNSFIKLGKIYGIATFYKKKLFKLDLNEFVDPINNISEYFFNLIKVFLDNKIQPKSVLKTVLTEKKSRKKIEIFNIHLFFIGSNQARVSTIKKFLSQNLNKKNSKNQSMIICGDFNYYPMQRKKLEKMMKNLGFKEATKNICQTINPYKKYVKNKYVFLQKLIMPFFKFFAKTFKIDYIFYNNLKNIKTIRIENRFSDHYPILSFFEI
ncbi:MAG: hypothetical protein Fur009_4030 [Candidatus Microgenomates bacterium]